MTNEGIENLTNAIILQAVKDYRKALKGFSLNGKPSAAVIADCERFFRSGWYRQLTNVDGEYLITNIRKEYGQRLDDAVKKWDSGRLEKKSWK